MKFQYENFSCDVDIFTSGDDLMVRFYDSSIEQNEEQICNLVIVDPGYGVICLKFKGAGGLLSGFLDESVFSEAAVESAIEFVEKLSPRRSDAYIPHHVRRFKATSYIEYNGEY
jgi:hypothetical protein